MKYILTSLLLFSLAPVAFGQIKKVTELPATGTLSGTDTLYVVRPGDETPDRKTTFADILDMVDGATRTFTNKTLSGSSNTFSNIPQSAVTSLTTDLAGKQAASATLSSYAALDADGLPKVVVHNGGTTPSFVNLSQFVMAYEEYNNPSWLTGLAWSKVTGTPTTLSGYGITNGQPLDATLTALAGVTTAANQGIYATGSDAFTTYSLTAGGRALAGVAGTANTIPYFSSSNTAALLTTTANGRALLNYADPNADRIIFWDDSAGALTNLAPGNSVVISGTTLDTVQDIRTSATPQFQRLSLQGAGTVSQLHLNQSTGLGGAYLYSGSDTNGCFSSGSQYSGGWIARGTTSSIIAMDNGEFNYFGNVGLTPGATFSPNLIAVLTPTGRFGVGNFTPASAIHATATDAATSTVTEITRRTHQTSGTAAAGFGAADATELENASGVNRIASQLSTRWVTPTNTSESAEYVIEVRDAGALVEALKLGKGKLILPNLPTSATGLASGQVWNDSGTLKIAP